MKFGVYRDDCEGLHPDTINKYYGVHGKETRRTQGQTGAGHPTDEEAESDDDSTSEPGSAVRGNDLAQRVADDLESDIRHDAIPVPDHRNPFNGNADLEGEYFDKLQEIIVRGDMPTGFGILEDEWVDGMYPTVEVIPAGRKGSKEIRVSLAAQEWKARAGLWCQALAVLSHFR
ncbi:hypothetical protein PLICRDRAFT_45380 [Plicaturopsis crispa FD-325 SS-3]|uniref:Uncharacterized protein n=1 Tax=Plicaturopsis crispa FD-325 SS-3 TaxID=944288 RepID=A0A0C9T7D9_PLICR|nr:hypothetical protein PLICRDRAFT_45380 [Plicaturopsis crispa FD-325 SS-3]